MSSSKEVWVNLSGGGRILKMFGPPASNTQDLSKSSHQICAKTLSGYKLLHSCDSLMIEGKLFLMIQMPSVSGRLLSKLFGLWWIASDKAPRASKQLASEPLGLSTAPPPPPEKNCVKLLKLYQSGICIGLVLTTCLSALTKHQKGFSLPPQRARIGQEWAAAGRKAELLTQVHTNRIFKPIWNLPKRTCQSPHPTRRPLRTHRR